MDATMKTVCGPNKNIRITKWKVKPGQQVSHGAILCIYETDDAKGLKIKSSDVGTVHEIMGQQGDRKPPGSVLVTIEPCKHPTVMKDMCAECGADLREEAGLAGERREAVTATVAMVHSIPELIISEEQAREIGREDENRLIKTKKLVLLVDLDQTLIHTTNDNIPANLKGVFHYQLRQGHGLMWYHTRIRPGTQHFLETISKMYELHICTFGVRMYAHTIARYLDPDEKYFSHRILSRDECFNPNSKTANLKALFPCGDKMVCIIDDREDVWNYAPNLIHVKPYRFFQGTADINAPPGLTKTEHDSEPMQHRVRKVSRSNSMEEQSEKGNDIKSNISDTKGDNLKSVSESDDNKIANEGIENKDDLKQDDKISNKKCNENLTDDTLQKTSGSQSDSENNNKNVKGQGDSNKQEQNDQSELKISNDIKQSEKSEKDGNEPEKPLIKDSENDQNTESSMETDKTMSDGKDNQSISTSTKATENIPCTKKQTNIESSHSDNTKTDKSAENLSEEDVEIEWDDEDDYLLYLEEILTRIHKTFFDFYDQLKAKKEKDEIPDLKDIISYIKRKVLQGVNIVFSGVFPTNIAPEKSRAYMVAKALGANVQTNIIPKSEAEKGQATTHLVAAIFGTSKVKQAMKVKGIQIVNSNWLWCCAERYEHVDERLFQLDKETSDSPDITQDKNRKRKSDPADMGESDSGKRQKKEDNDSIEDSENEPSTSEQSTQDEKSNENVNFTSTYNPLLAFSDDDLACMDKEVEELMDEDQDDNSSEDEEERDSRLRSFVLSSGDDENSSEDSLSGDLPRGWKKKERTGSSESPGNSENGNESENDLEQFENTVSAFAPDTESDNESIGSMDDEMAAAIEKEFLEL